MTNQKFALVLISFCLWHSDCSHSHQVDHIKQRFDNFKVFSMENKTPQQLEAVQLLEKTNAFQFMKPPANGKADIIVPPKHRKEFNDFTNRFKVERILKVNNVQE